VARRRLPLIKPPRRPNAVAAATGLAASILRRNLRVGLGPWRARMVLVLRPEPVSHETHVTQTSPQIIQRIEPRISVFPMVRTLHARTEALRETATLKTLREVTRAGSPARHSVTRIIERQPVPSPLRLTRAGPVVPGDASREASAPRPVQKLGRVVAPVQPVPRVVAAPARAFEPPTPAEPAPTPLKTRPSGEVYPTAPDAPVLTSQQVVERLTDTVMRRIDERFVSERERREPWP